MTAETLRNFLQPPLAGLVLESYGAGNFPVIRKDLMTELESGIQRGIIVVNCTQCFKGGVTADYETGSNLSKIGVVSGQDMTPEAALTKLAYLLSQPDLHQDDIRRLLGVNMRGELSASGQREQLRIPDARELMSQIQSASMNTALKNEMTPELLHALEPLMLTGASRLNNLKRARMLLAAGADPNGADLDGRTALHIAAEEGHLEMANLMLEYGALINSKDRWGCTPLRQAIRHQNPQIIKLLRSKNAVVG